MCIYIFQFEDLQMTVMLTLANDRSLCQPTNPLHVDEGMRNAPSVITGY